MEICDNDLPFQQHMEASSKMLTYCDSEGKGKENELLKVEMTPLQVGSGHTESTVLSVTSDQPPVQDHIIWSIFNTIYMNFCCLGFIALIFSVKSRDRKGMGDRLGAIIYGSKARTLNIVTCILTAIWFIVMIILMALGFFSIPLIMRG
ncbi:interferon-induced transmembrane protein 1-like [Pyxicephalus adspersus]